MHLKDLLLHINALPARYRRFLKWSVIALVICVGLGSLAILTVRPQRVGLQGTYYANDTWQAPAVLETLDTEFNSAVLRTFRDDVSNNRFSVVWEGYLYIPRSADYSFTTESDDGSWVFIDDQLVVDNGGTHGKRRVVGQRYLAEGLHTITIRYMQAGGDLALWVLWENVYHETTQLPEKFLLPPDANLTKFRLYQAGKTLLWDIFLFCGLLLAGIGVVLLIEFAATTIRTQKYSALVLLFFLMYLIIGLGIFDDYGFSWDEATQRQIGLMNWRYIFDDDQEIFEERHINERYYGPVFEIFLIFIERSLRLSDSRDIYLMRHLVTFLLFYASVYFFYVLCKTRFGSWKAGLLGSTLLILSPRIFAHAFYNSKDIPLLALFIISMYTLVAYIQKKTWSQALLHALCCALLIDIRLVGGIVPCLTYVMVLGDILLTPQPKRIWKQAIVTLSVYTALLPLFIILFFPVIWSNPPYHLYQAFLKMRAYPWKSTVWYAGQFVWSNNLPWHYVPVWISITTPILYTISFVAGTLISVAALRKKPLHAHARLRAIVDVTCLIWFFLPILLIMTSKSVLYNAWRHLFFIYPAFLMFSLHGLLSLFRICTSQFTGKRYALAITVCMLFAGLCFMRPVSFMIKNHPYQNVYFNRLAGKNMPSIKQRFELDYWGLSYRTALEYVLRTDQREQIAVHAATEVGETSANILRPEDRKRLRYVPTPEMADYFMSNFLWHPDEYAYDDEVFSIKIDGAKIIVVYRLRD